MTSHHNAQASDTKHQTRFSAGRVLRHTLLAATLAVSLSSCVAVAVIGGATAAGAVIADKRSFKQQLTDNNLAQKAQAKLDADPAIIRNAHISAAAFNNTLLLVGQAKTAPLKQRATEITQHIKGVKQLYNEVRIAGKATTMSRVNDSWLTTKVKTALLQVSKLNATSIKVVTEDGVVYLMGIVNRQTADLAVNATRKVSGVTQVVKVFRIDQDAD